MRLVTIFKGTALLEQLVILVVGLAILITGAELLVHGSVNIAEKLGISALVVGLTVVAFGTSAPELFVSVNAALRNQADVSVGNVVGSNIFNILMIIGLSAVVAPIQISRSVMWREMPIMLVVMGLFVWFGFDGAFSKKEGVLLFVGILTYLFYNYLFGDVEAFAEAQEEEDAHAIEQRYPWIKAIPVSVVLVILGILGLAYGSDLAVASATTIARSMAISELVIGITLIAVGTSLPELATTVVAASKGQPDLAVGNAIGSNVFNVLCVIGITSAITPLDVNQSLINVDFYAMFAACLFCWVLMGTRRTINRAEGAAMVLFYLGYTTYLLVMAQNA